MKKKLIVIALVMLMTLSLAGCCKHQWQEATCGAPKTCALCGKTKGSPVGEHQWQEATCTEPKT